MSGGRDAALHARAQRLIPGGCHTYSKGDDQFPANAPRLLERAEGCWAWDPDGGRWLDYGMGLRAVLLGHAYAPVVEAVRAELVRGSNLTRPSPLEGELAEELHDLFPCAEMVKFAKNGSDVTSAAVRLARAYTGRDLVAACRANPFYSFDDWWIGTTAMSSGIPRDYAALTKPFDYDDLPGLAAIFDAHPGQVACVMIEPVALARPSAGFLQGLADLAHRHGALVIFDEMICGFRYHLRGAHGLFGVSPDLATYGKALGNGFSVSALCGRADVMRLGGSSPDRERVFLLSATHGAETHALAAALAAVRAMRGQDVVAHVRRLGARLRAGVAEAAREAGLSDHLECLGWDESPVLVCRGADRKPSLPLRTLLLQELAARKVLIPYVAISLAHGDAELDLTLDALRAALPLYRRALEDGAERHLLGPAVKPVFRRFN